MGAYRGTPVLKHHYQSDLWAFYFEEQNVWRHIDSADLKEAMPRTHGEMTALLDSEIELLGQKLQHRDASYSIHQSQTFVT